MTQNTRDNRLVRESCRLHQQDFSLEPELTTVTKFSRVNRGMPSLLIAFLFLSFCCQSIAFPNRFSPRRLTTGYRHSFLVDTARVAKNTRLSRSKSLQKNVIAKAVSASSIQESATSNPQESRNNVQRPDSSGALLAFAIVLILAVTTEEAQLFLSARELDDVDIVARDTVTNVLVAAVPTSSTDLVAVALGESIGGVIGAISGALISMVGTRNGIARKPLITKAIADSDFFIANSASLPLLQATGLPPALASIGSVIFAAIPSQLVKIGSQENERRVLEEELLEQLLEEEKRREEERNSFFKPFLFQTNTMKSKKVDPVDLTPAVEGNLDVVDIFSDVTRWLAYNVLKADFGDNLIIDGIMLDSSITGALYGLVAAVASQLYADILYRYYRYGPKSRRLEVFERRTIDWLAIYSAKAISTAVLFGVYEFSQGPISRWIQGTLAGGVDGCIGSTSFDLCLQTYIDTNAPGPSTEAQFRALVTNLVMVGQRLQDISVDTSFEDVKALVGAWSVAAVSYAQTSLPVFLPISY